MSEYMNVKKIVVEACHRLSSLGYLAGIGGNVAARIWPQLMAVTPSAADYFSMKPDDICVLDLETLEKLEGDGHPSVESGMHALVFRNRPDLNASVHTHQPIASAMAVLNQSIPLEEVEEKEALGIQVPVVAYGPSGTSMLVRALSKKLDSNTNGYLLRNHGIISGGPNMDQAIRNVQLIEQAAARYLRNAFERNHASVPGPLRRLARAALQ